MNPFFDITAFSFFRNQSYIIIIYYIYISNNALNECQFESFQMILKQQVNITII